jgi:ligand-binding sensor domain-containing protein
VRAAAAAAALLLIVASAHVAEGTSSAAPAAKASAPAAVSASVSSATVVHSSVEEARACLPLPSGGALVGTAGGLMRLDATGAVTGVWTASEGLPGTRIESITEATAEEVSGSPDRALWIGTDAGVARIALSSASALRILESHPGRPVRDVARFGGATYLATWNGGVRKLGAAGSTEVPLRGGKLGGARAQVSSLAVAGGALYAGTAAGLFQLDGAQLVPVSVERPDVPDIAGASRAPAPLSIAALHGDGDTLWIASSEGLYARRPDGVVRSFGGGDLRALAALDGAVIVASVVEGLQRVDRGRLVAFAGAPRQLTFAQALGVRGEAMCTGGLEGAWLRAAGDGAPWIRAAPRQGPPSSDISALAVEGARLWVGTFDRGLAVLESGRWRAVAHPDLDARINALLVEPRPARPARLWIATANGLSTLEDAGAGAAPIVRRLARADGMPGRGVLALTRLADGRILAGTSYGAVLVDPRSAAAGDAALARPVRLGAKQPDGGSLGTIWAVAQTSDGVLWLGTTTGLYRGRADALAGDDAAAWQRFSLATGHLSDDWVTALVARGAELYAGTYKGGVVRLAPGAADLAPGAAGAPTSVVAAAGGVIATRLHDGWINPGGLVFDGDRLLAATMEGLLVGTFSGAPTDGGRWSTLPGLPGVDVTASARLGGTLYVSTRRGLAERTERTERTERR